jgi:uncharacterized protein YbjQ (UPF0145 family)
MDKPFSAENSPFLTPYLPPGGDALGIKPFAANDLAPSSAAPPAQNGHRLNAPPQASPFLERDPEKAFPSLAAAALAPAPAVFPLAPKPPPDFVPAAAPFVSPPSAEPQSDVSALRASATPRRGSGTEAYPKSALTMTDADASAEAASLLMTTGPNVEGRRILSYLGVVSVEIVIPKDVLFRNPAPYGELHRLKAAEEHLQRVKQKAFEELSAKARALGANGVVGATLQFSQFDAMVFLCAALGTAVKIE